MTVIHQGRQSLEMYMNVNCVYLAAPRQLSLKRDT